MRKVIVVGAIGDKELRDKLATEIEKLRFEWEIISASSSCSQLGNALAVVTTIVVEKV